MLMRYLIQENLRIADSLITEIQVVEHWKKCSEPGYQLFKLFHCVDWLTMLVTLDSYLQISGDHQPAVPLARDSEPESVRYGLDFRPSVV